MLAGIVAFILDLLLWGILAWVILSWVQTGPGHPLRRVQEFLDRLILPLIRPIQKIVPPLRLGCGAIDLSPIILILLIRLFRNPLVSLFARF